MKKRNTGKKIAKYVVIAIILFVLLFPVYWMINCSLLPSNVIMSVPPRFFPINATLKNFSQIFTRASYLRFFQNSSSSPSERSRSCCWLRFPRATHCPAIISLDAA